MEVAEITEKLEQGIRDVYSSDKWMNWLDTMSKFHRYSANNSLLISMQNPAATLVAGYKAWEKNFERHVLKGEKGIQILAPSPKKIKQKQPKTDIETGELVIDQNGNPVIEEVTITINSYRPVTVFDVSQTEGKELPKLTETLVGSVADYDDYISALKELSPVPIEFAEINEGNADKSLKGYFSSKAQIIKVQEALSEVQTVKTLVHEIAHAQLHDYSKGDWEDMAKLDRSTKEVQAESVAYTVCKHFGIDTSGYSFAYVATWSRDKELMELKASMEVIQRTSSEFIIAIEDKLMSRVQERELEDFIDEMVYSEPVVMQQIKGGNVMSLSKEVRERYESMSEHEKEAHIDGVEFTFDNGMDVSKDDKELYDFLIEERSQKEATVSRVKPVGKHRGR